jgi:hypothetical protein
MFNPTIMWLDQQTISVDWEDTDIIYACVERRNLTQGIEVHLGCTDTAPFIHKTAQDALYHKLPNDQFSVNFVYRTQNGYSTYQTPWTSPVNQYPLVNIILPLIVN